MCGSSYVDYPTWFILHGLSYMVYPTWFILHGLSYVVYPTQKSEVLESQE